MALLITGVIILATMLIVEIGRSLGLGIAIGRQSVPDDWFIYTRNYRSRPVAFGKNAGITFRGFTLYRETTNTIVALRPFWFQGSFLVAKNFTNIKGYVTKPMFLYSMTGLKSKISPPEHCNFELVGLAVNGHIVLIED